MKVCTPNYFSKFKCINSACSDTCCKHWQVELDDSTYIKYYKAVKESTSLGKTIERYMRKGKKSYFKNCRNGSCPFLDSNQLCSLHIEHGYDVLPHTCKEFPRFYNLFGLYEEIGLSFSCPEAAKIICSGDENLTVFYDDRIIESYTDVDAELFYAVKKARDNIYDFLSNSNLNLNKKILSVLDYSDRVQKAINKNEYASINAFKIDLVDSAVIDFNSIKNKAIKKHLKFNILRDDWKVVLNKALSNSYNISDQEGTVWLKYFVFRYLINSAKDKRFINVINGAIYSLAVIGSLEFRFEVSAQKYSKEIEHNEANIKKILKFKKIF